MKYEDLRPFLKKHVWLLPIISIFTIITFPISFPSAMLISYRKEIWNEIKYSFEKVKDEIKSAFIITYAYYTNKD